MTGSVRPRLIFANQLRAVAVLMVLLAHYTVVVNYFRRDIAWVLGAPVMDTRVPAVADWLFPVYFDMGTFAVAVFFLISGFVIPFSLQASTAGQFLLARGLRIYPTFWAALLVEAAIASASAGYWRDVPAYGPRSYVVNGLLIETLLGEQTVDWVSWTLSVEVKFYLLAAVLRPLILRARLWPVAAVAGAALALNGLAAQGVVHLPVELVSETTYLAFIFIGVLFHYHYQGALGAIGLTLGAGLLLGVVAACWLTGPMVGDRVLKISTMAVALVVFAIAYRLRERFRRNRLLDGLAAISYPLYLVHSVFGFAVLSFMTMAWRLPYAVSAPLAVAASVVLAVVLHRFVERPTIALGRGASLKPGARLSSSLPLEPLT